jgi:hypothetical protein
VFINGHLVSYQTALQCQNYFNPLLGLEINPFEIQISEKGFPMVKKALFTSLLSITVLLTGCATRTKMAFENDGDKWTEKSKAVLLMTATIKNSYRTYFQPKLTVVHVEKPNAKDASDRLNFVTDDKAKSESNNPELGNSYLIRMELDPGKYEIRGLTSIASAFPVNGFFFAPLHSEITITDPGIYYLGHVKATVRERNGDEFKAGPSIPLIDQAVAGASGGTFDIAITEEFDQDEALFKSKFPALSGVNITKAILAPFDRAKAQSWWQAN